MDGAQLGDTAWLSQFTWPGEPQALCAQGSRVLPCRTVPVQLEEPERVGTLLFNFC